MSNFKLISVTDGWGICCEIALRWFPLDLTDDKLSIGLGTGFVLPGKKSLPEPMLSQIFAAELYHPQMTCLYSCHNMSELYQN